MTHFQIKKENSEMNEEPEERCARLEVELEQMTAARDESELKNAKLRQIAKKWKDEKEKAESTVSSLQLELNATTAAHLSEESKAIQAESMMLSVADEKSSLASKLASMERALIRSRDEEAAAKDRAAQKERELAETNEKFATIEEELRTQLEEKDDELRHWRNWKQMLFETAPGLPTATRRSKPQFNMYKKTYIRQALDRGAPKRKKRKIETRQAEAGPSPKTQELKRKANTLFMARKAAERQSAVAPRSFVGELSSNSVIANLQRRAYGMPEDVNMREDSNDNNDPMLFQDNLSADEDEHMRGRVKHEPMDDDADNDHYGDDQWLEGASAGQEERRVRREQERDNGRFGGAVKTPTGATIIPRALFTASRRPTNRRKKFKKSKDANLCTKAELVERIAKLSEFLYANPVTEDEFAAMTLEERIALPGRVPWREGLTVVDFNNKVMVLGNAIKYYEKKLENPDEDEDDEEEDQDEEQQGSLVVKQERGSEERSSSSSVRPALNAYNPGPKGKKSKDANLCTKEELAERIVALSNYLHKFPVTLEELLAMTSEQRFALPQRGPIKSNLRATDVSNKMVTFTNAIKYYELKREDKTPARSEERYMQHMYKTDNQTIKEATVTAWKFITAQEQTDFTNVAQEELEDQLVRCIRAFPGQKPVIANLRQQTDEQRTMHIQCLCSGKKFPEIHDWQKAIKKIYEILVRDHWKDEASSSTASPLQVKYERAPSCEAAFYPSA